jgi:hypothetical protein
MGRRREGESVGGGDGETARGGECGRERVWERERGRRGTWRVGDRSERSD